MHYFKIHATKKENPRPVTFMSHTPKMRPLSISARGFYTRFMSRIAFCCVWLVLPACFAQTTTLRPDAAPAEDPEMRAEAVRLMERRTC